MSIRLGVLCVALLVAASAAAAQTNGSITGRVRQREGGQPVLGAEVGLDGRWLAQTDSAGFYRMREVRSGWHVVTMRAIGFDTMRRDSVLVRAGQVTVVNFTVAVYTIEQPIVVEAYADSILDPSLVATVQRLTGDELRRFPVTTLEEAVALFAQPPRRRGGKGAARGPLKELGADPASGRPIVVRDGRFGPYVTDGETNASLRRGDTPESVTVERASELLAERRAKSA